MQQRLGRDGRLFTLIKIRSLPEATPPSVNKYQLHAFPTTRFGRFLRRTHLDELPQCWLVLTGRMSLVGPRPEMPQLAAQFDPSFISSRNSVRPGLTGLWQLSSASGKLIAEAKEFDLYYLHQASALLDAWILYRTLRRCFFARCISISDIPRCLCRQPSPQARQSANATDHEQAPQSPGPHPSSTPLNLSGE